MYLMFLTLLEQVTGCGWTLGGFFLYCVDIGIFLDILHPVVHQTVSLSEPELDIQQHDVIPLFIRSPTISL